MVEREPNNLEVLSRDKFLLDMMKMYDEMN